MIAPAAAVVGGAVMLWLALTTYDGLVSDDYYKEGLAINQVCVETSELLNWDTARTPA